MASTTALTLVNRLLRRHGFEDVSVLTQPEGLLSLDLVNQAIQDLLAMRDYPWNVRSDGVLNLRGLIDTDGTGLTIDSATPSVGFIPAYTVALTDITGGTDAGTVVARLWPYGVASLSETAFNIVNVSDILGTMQLTLSGEWPNTTFLTKEYKIFFSEYVLPDAVAKVMSVRHQEQPVALLQAPPHASFDELMPRPHDTEGEPEVVATGGTATATCSIENDTEQVATVGLRLMVWPIPDVDYVLHYSYKERLAPLTTTTSTLLCPDEFVWDVIDRAEALSNMTQRFNAPELAAQQMRSSIATAERKYVAATLDPSRRSPLRPHDRSLRRRDFTRYRDIDGL